MNIKTWWRDTTMKDTHRSSLRVKDVESVFKWTDSVPRREAANTSFTHSYSFKDDLERGQYLQHKS